MKKYKLRFDYHQSNGYYKRTVKTWWKPFYFMGNILKKVLYFFGVKTYSNKIWFIRKYLTYD